MDTSMKKYKKIIVWGALPDTGHTHCFIHDSIARAAASMGIETYWLDNRHNVPPEFFDDAIIISEQWLVFANGNSNRLPLRKSSCYIIHYLGNKGPVEGNPGASMYLGKVGKLIDFRFASDWGMGSVPDKNYAYHFEPEKYEKLSVASYYESGDLYDNFYSIWATDLLPEEIRLTDRLYLPKEPKYAFFGGTIRDDNKKVFDGFIKACNDTSVAWVHNCPWKNPLSINDIRTKVRESFIAPDFRPDNHISNNYISCRILKNISYGKMGVTNSKAAYDFFNKEVIFDENTELLFYKAKESAEMQSKIIGGKDAKLLFLMNDIKKNHTYINRVNDMIKAAEI